MRVAKAKGHLRGKQPKLNPRQEAHLVELLRSGEYSTAELGDLFGVARSTVYRAVARSKTAAAARRAATTAPQSRAVSRLTVDDGALAAPTGTYRPRHGAPSDLPSRTAAVRAHEPAPGQHPANGKLSADDSTAHLTAARRTSCAASGSPIGTPGWWTRGELCSRRERKPPSDRRSPALAPECRPSPPVVHVTAIPGVSRE